MPLKWDNSPRLIIVLDRNLRLSEISLQINWNVDLFARILRMTLQEEYLDLLLE